MPDEELQKLISQLYGDTRTRGKTLIADAALLALENGAGPSSTLQPEPTLAPSLGPGLSGANGTNNQGSQPQGAGTGTGSGGAASGEAAGAPPKPPQAPQPQVALPPGVPAGSKFASQMDKLSSRLGGPGGSTGAGFGAPAAQPAAGTKRVAPTPAAAPAASAKAPSPAKGPAAKRQAVAAPAATAAGASGAAVAASGLEAQPRALLPPMQQQPLMSCCLGRRPKQTGNVAEQQAGEEMVVLEAANTFRDYRGQVQGRVVCSVSGRQLWFDAVQGTVVALSGSLYFAAVATSLGDLLVFSAAGRRLLPPIALGELVCCERRGTVAPGAFLCYVTPALAVNQDQEGLIH